MVPYYGIYLVSSFLMILFELAIKEKNHYTMKSPPSPPPLPTSLTLSTRLPPSSGTRKLRGKNTHKYTLSAPLINISNDLVFGLLCASTMEES